MAYIYAGQSLINYGEPISWSSFDYKENTWQEMTVNSDTVNKQSSETFVKPWFDHPMLLPIITGGLSVSAGYDFPSIPPALLFRLPMLLFATGTLILSFLIAKHLFDYWPAVFTLALLGGSPALIFIQRMVVGENAVIFFLLLAMYAYLKKWNIWIPIAAVILATQAKVVGIVVAPIISYLYVLENKWKQAISFGVGAVAISLILLIGIGNMYAGSNYLTALQKQSTRLIGWSNPASILSNPGFQNYDFLDFSYYAILILGIAGVVVYKHDSNKMLLGILAILLALIWVTSAETDFLGWYKIPLFVMLTISSAAFMAAKSFNLPLLLMGITVVNNLGLVRYPTHQFPDGAILRGGVLILMIVFFATLLWVKNTSKQAVIVSCVMVLYLLQSAYIVDKYFESRCMDLSSCTVPKVTFSETVKGMLK